MAKSEKQLKQERQYEEWKRRRDAKADSESDTSQPPSEISHAIERQQPRVQKPDLLSATTSSSKEKERANNREKYPEIAAFVDECRRVFGEGVRVVSITPHKDRATHVSDVEDGSND